MESHLRARYSAARSCASSRLSATEMLVGMMGGRGAWPTLAGMSRKRWVYSSPLPAPGHRDVGRDDGRARRVAYAGRDVAEALGVLGRLRPLVLHDDEQTEAELGHDLGRL